MYEPEAQTAVNIEVVFDRFRYKELFLWPKSEGYQ